MSVVDKVAEEMVNGFIDLMEQGVTPWKKGWVNDGYLFPTNFMTQVQYSGINVLILGQVALYKGYTSNLWVTMKQANKLGGKVIKGEHGTICFRYVEKMIKNRSYEPSDPDSEEYIKIPAMRYFKVFNLDQIDGLEKPKPEPRFVTDESVEQIDLMMDQYCEATGCGLMVGGNKAYYLPLKHGDFVMLPGDFLTASDYISVKAHEFVHSTGHPFRLDRFSHNNKAFGDFDESYAYEELVASMGESFFCRHFGVTDMSSSHASYLDHWLGQLKSDKSLLFKAAADAQKAYNFILEQQEQSQFMNNVA